MSAGPFIAGSPALRPGVAEYPISHPFRPPATPVRMCAVPDPGVARRKRLPALLKDTPARAVVIDSFEQRTQRPKRRQRAYYSGKKKAHTLKNQVAVDEHSGRIV